VLAKAKLSHLSRLSFWQRASADRRPRAKFWQITAALLQPQHFTQAQHTISHQMGTLFALGLTGDSLERGTFAPWLRSERSAIQAQ